jgi:single-strand DNA-binding protein
MPNFNKVYLMGNLTRDIEMRITPKGTAIGQFGLAINRSWKNEAGQLQEETTFADIEVWGRQAETLSKYVKRGSPLFVEGRLKFDQWEDKTSGQKRSKLKVVLENFQFLGGKKDGTEGGGEGDGHEASNGNGQRQASAEPAARNGRVPAKDTVDEDVPFLQD